MKALVRFAVTAGFLAASACMAYGASIQGYLVDKACGAKMATSNDQKAAAGHTRQCALMPNCVGSGFGVLTADGKFVTLDAAGNTKAEAALKASKKTDNIKVEVTGDQTGESMKVTTIKIL
jgi:ribosomal protein S19